MMEQAFKSWTLHVASGIESGAGIVIGIAALIAIARSFILFTRRPERQDKKEAVRLQLGRWLAVGLEIELAADILRTAVAPTWTEIGQLGAIIALRTVLNYFLQERHRQSSGARAGNAAAVIVMAKTPHTCKNISFGQFTSNWSLLGNFGNVA